jgi:hypothetical protein
MFFISLYRWYCLMAENQPRIKRTVLFVNASPSLSCRKLGRSGPKLHRLVIHPFLGLRTDMSFVSFVVIHLIHGHSFNSRSFI